MGKSNVKNIYPLSPMQEGLLFHALADPQSSAYFEQISYRLLGDLAWKPFHEAWQEVVRRHDILRTVFVHENTDRPLQVVLKDLALHIEIEDLSTLDSTRQNERIESFKACDLATPFDLRKGPLMRLRLFKLGPLLHEVVWSHHHILMDGWSLGVLQAEFGEIYRAHVLGCAPRLQLPVAYSAFVKWLEKRLVDESDRYWADLLANYESPAGIPSIRPRGVESRVKRELHRVLPPKLASAVATMGGPHGVTQSTILQCVWAIVLARYNQVEDVVFGTVISGRSAEIPGIERLVGICVNTIPVRIQPTGDRSFLDLIVQTQRQALRGEPFHHIPLARIQRLSELKQALISTHFSFENFPLAERLNTPERDESRHSLSVSGVSTFERTHYDFDIQVVPGNPCAVRLAYRTDLYEEAYVEQIWGHFGEVLEAVAANENIRLDDISLVNSEEARRLLEFGRAVSVCTVSEELIHRRFEALAAQNPDEVAVSFEETRMTYGELNDRAEALARRLRAVGVEPESRVGICLERSIEMVLAILSILKAGGAYVPLEPSLPKNRLAYLIGDSGAALILTRTELRNNLPQTAKCLCLDATEPDCIPESRKPSLGAKSPDSPAYVIYTSGSTGLPKGVEITHRNVMRLFDQTDAWFRFGPDDVWSLFHSYAFDFSVWEIWGALLYGGRLVIVPYWTSRSPDLFRHLLVTEGITVLNQTPSAFKQLIHADAASPNAAPYSLRLIIFGGEALELRSLRPWFEKHGDQRPQLVNMYGITETTVHVTYRPLVRADLDAGGSVIGRPIPDLSMAILDPMLRPAPIGVSGEIYVGGPGLARGYLGRPDLTAARFVPNPFATSPGERLYRTGDLARFLPDGDIEYLGRIDNQVKIRGFRIELGEIEAALLTHESVRQAVVMLRRNAGAEGEILAYVMPARRGGFVEPVLRDYLRSRLADYMVPAAIVEIDSVPLTTNGKVDYSALPEPRQSPREARYVAPRSAMEQALALVWSEVLCHEQVGVTENYFALGGDSIKAIQIVSRALRSQIKVTIPDIFKHPTIADLAPRAGMVETHAAPSRPSGEPFELGPIQRWFFHQHTETPEHFNHAVLLESHEPLNESALAVALREILAHHAALRLRFREEAGAWLQVVEPIQNHLPLEIVDLRAEPRPEETLSQRAIGIQRKFDLKAGPLFKLVAFSGNGKNWLLFIAHHLVVDGISWRVLLADFSTAYQQILRNAVVQLPPPTSPYSAWVERLVQWTRSTASRPALEYWTRFASQVRAPREPMEAGTYGEEEIVTVEIDTNEPGTWLAKANRVYTTQTEDLILTALAHALREGLGLRSALVATEGHGRNGLGDDLDLTRTVGWYTSLYPIWIEVDEARDLGYQIKSMKESLRAIPDQGSSYGVIRFMMEGSDVSKAIRGLAPLMSVNFMGDLDAGVQVSGWRLSGLPLGPMVSPAARRPFPMGLAGFIAAGKLKFTFQYNPRGFNPSGARRFAEVFRDSLVEIVEFCHRRTGSEMTPSDLTYSKIGLDELEGIFND